MAACTPAIHWREGKEDVQENVDGRSTSSHDNKLHHSVKFYNCEFRDFRNGVTVSSVFLGYATAILGNRIPIVFILKCSNVQEDCQEEVETWTV